MKGEGWDDAGIRDAFRDSIGSDTTELFLDYIKEFSTAIDNVRSDIGLDGNMKVCQNPENFVIGSSITYADT